ncbi:MAG TPA: hypothetical protein VFF16_09355 [Telluria sp.]|nr:hypothetical protein [Telluria sp.]
MEAVNRAPADLRLPLARELARLRRPLLLFLAALAAAIVMVGLSGWMRDEQQLVLSRAQRTYDSALARLQNTERERNDIHLYQPRFLVLRADGVVGNENRLAWIDAIRQSQASRRLLSVAYEAEPQQTVGLSAPIALGEYQLRASRMQLHAGLLHEMDLFNLLDDLRGAGLYTVHDCRIKRIEVPADVALTPRLTADCTLAWVTLGSAPAPAAPTKTPGTP